MFRSHAPSIARDSHPPLTITALYAGAISIAWIAERLLGIQTPADAIVNSIAGHGILAASALLMASLACRYMSVKENARFQGEVIGSP